MREVRAAKSERARSAFYVRPRSGLLPFTFVHEAFLRGTLERLAVGADRLRLARLALAFREEARFRRAAEFAAVFSDCLACARSWRLRRPRRLRRRGSD